MFVCLKKKSFKDVKIRLFVCFKCLQEIQTSEKVGKLIRSIHTQRLGGLSMAWAQGRDCPLQHLCKWWCLGKGHSLWQPSPLGVFPSTERECSRAAKPRWRCPLMQREPACAQSQPSTFYQYQWTFWLENHPAKNVHLLPVCGGAK